MIIKNTKGNSLIIVVVATFILLSISLYLSKFVFNQIKIQNDTTKLKSSIYAAESGIERTLYLVRKNNISLNNVINNNTYNTENLSNSSSYKIVQDSSQTSSLSIPYIAANSTYSFEITNYVSQIRSFTVNWTSPGNELMYISVGRYRSNGRLQSYVIRNTYNHYFDSPVTINLNVNPQRNMTYRLLLNPRYYQANNVNVVFYSGPNGNGNVVDVSGNSSQRIKSIGNIGDNNKTMISDFLIDGEY